VEQHNLEMSFGAVRHVGDIRVDDIAQDGQGYVGLQMGQNKGANQSGMSFGGVRHGGDMYQTDQMDDASRGIVNLQYGSPLGANQAGMSYGGRRDIM